MKLLQGIESVLGGGRLGCKYHLSEPHFSYFFVHSFGYALKNKLCENPKSDIFATKAPPPNTLWPAPE